MSLLTSASMSSSASAMPPSTSPRLKIGQATDAENIDIWTLKWHPPLNQSAYVAKEEHCASQLITANRGITHWILYEDEGSPSSSTENQTKAMKKVLASTDTIRRRALVTTFAHDGQAVLQEVPCHQICRMFCRKEHRGKRYPARMLQELKPVLETWQQEDGGAKVKFTVLYSDVGKVCSFPLFLQIHRGLYASYFDKEKRHTMENSDGSHTRRTISSYLPRFPPPHKKTMAKQQ